MTEHSSSFGHDSTLSEELNDFISLLHKEFKPTSKQDESRLEDSVKTLAEFALADLSYVSGSAIDSIEYIVAELDRRISDQVNQIMHHPDFQKLEGSWRGLDYLVSHVHTNDELKIKILNISKKDFRRSFENYRGIKWKESPLFKMIYDEAYAQFGGEPFCCLIGDYYFDHNIHDIRLLNDISCIATAASTPFVAGISPTLLGLADWSDVNNFGNITKVLQAPEYAAWRSLRDSSYSRYLCFTLPRFLSRLPYGSNSLPVEEFDFEEDLDDGNHSNFTWSNSAFTLATNICLAYEHSGWPVHIQGVESGGAVSNLPVYTFPTDDGGMDTICPTETSITDARVKELINNGLTPLVYHKSSVKSYFLNVCTLYKAPEYEQVEWNFNAKLETKLPFVLAKAHFVHYLKAIVNKKMTKWKQPSDIEDWFNSWINDYVESEINPEIKFKLDNEGFQKPLSSAHIKVDEITDNPGYYNAIFYFRPHYQLNGFTVSLRIHCLLPMDEIRDNYLRI